MIIAANTYAAAIRYIKENDLLFKGCTILTASTWRYNSKGIGRVDPEDIVCVDDRDKLPVPLQDFLLVITGVYSKQD